MATTSKYVNVCLCFFFYFLIPASFEVTVNDQLVFSKLEQGGFPNRDEVWKGFYLPLYLLTPNSRILIG